MFSNSREWRKSDEYNDRAVTEGQVPPDDDPHNPITVDAVPGTRWRPGSRN